LAKIYNKEATMSENEQRHDQTGAAKTSTSAGSPLTTPPARLRTPSSDDLEIDVSDSVYDLPLDDSDRLRDDANSLRD
jgi:hypothetical protein